MPGDRLRKVRRFQPRYDRRQDGLWVATAAPIPPSGPPVLGYTGWYDASDTSIITHSGADVTVWGDKSGNNFHLVRNSGSIKTGTRSLNGLNVIEVPSADGNMDAAGNVTPSTVPQTVFVVGKHDSLADYRVLLDADNGTGGLGYFTQGNGKILYLKQNVAVLGTTTNTQGTSPFLLAVQFGTASSRWTMDLNIETGAGVATLTAGRNLRIFRGSDNANGLFGYLAEIITYGTLLSDADTALVATYLRDKWGL